MFVMKKVHADWWPCTAKVPNDEGKFEEETFSLLFETIEEEEATRIQEEVSAAERVGDKSKTHAVLRRAVKGWKEVVGVDKKPVEFSEEAFAQALSFPWFATAAYLGWTEAQSGRERTRKN